MTRNTAVASPAPIWHQALTQRPRPQKKLFWYWPAWFVGASAVAAVALTFVVWPKPVQSTTCLIYATSVTQQEGFPASLPPALVARAHALAATGGGSVVGVVAAGSTGEQVSQATSLRVETDGQLENDVQTREDTVAKRLKRLLADMKSTLPSEPGRSMAGLLAGVAAALGPDENQVWIATFGLPTAPGEDTRVLMAADPGAAAASIPASAITPLRNAQVHIVLLPPAGNQPALNATTDLWRKAFVTDVVRRSGALVADVTEDTIPSPPSDGAPVAPTVPNILIPTSLPKTTSTVSPGQPLSISLDTSTPFLPDSAEWADGTQQVRSELAPVAKAWTQANGYLVVTLTGYCARFGPAAGAIALSRQRAEKVAALLTSMGVAVDAKNVVGRGYTDPLPDPANPQSLHNRTVVVTARTI